MTSRRLALFLVCAFLCITQAMAQNTVAKIGDTGYSTLSAALKAAVSGQIITIAAIQCNLDENGVLKSGVTLDVPKNTTLLIPFDESNTCYTSEPEAVGDTKTSTAYRTLTMESGASMTVEGSVSVSAKMNSASGSQSGAGAVAGKYGHIKMESGSTITLTNTAKLYVWGYISGDGHIVAKSGTTVYEGFQINDFQGGSAISKIADKVFPFSQYSVQNIEAFLTIEHGAQEKVLSNLYIGLFSKTPTSTGQIDFVGTTNGLFRLAALDSKLTKRYNADTDMMEYVIEGDASVSSIQFKFSTSVFGATTVSSDSYVLPITNNMSIIQNSGRLTIAGQDVELLPGVQVSIEEGAEMNIASGGNVYVYDKNEWKNYAMNGAIVNPVTYTVATGGKPKVRGDGKNLNDTKIVVKGTLTADGNLYTTSSGANICCEEGSGRVVMNAVPAETKTYQYTRNGRNVEKQEVNVNSAWLNTGETDENGNAIYIKTAERGAGTYASVKQENGTTTWAKTEADGTLPSDITLYTLNLTETSAEIPVSQNGSVNVCYGREFNKGWNSLVLPMKVTADELSEMGIVEAIEYAGSEMSISGMVTLKFNVVSDLEANKPYIVYFETKPTAISHSFTQKAVYTSENLASDDENTQFRFVGTYKAYGQGVGDNPIKNGDYIVTASGLKQTAGGNPIKAFRAFLQAQTQAAANAKIGFVVDGGEVTGIRAIELEQALFGKHAATGGKLYNLAGQRVDSNYKGIVIKNGKALLRK